MRQQNHESDVLRVNDKRGNPIEIAMVAVWRIVNPTQAIFQVENYQSYIKLQTEAALRHLATSFAYDHAGQENEITLLNGGDHVNKFIVNELGDRFKFAGVFVEEARLTHLMYSKEVTQVMLKRQQADALIAAKKTIVNGVASIVKDTLAELQTNIKFTEEAKTTLAGNLLVVLCSESQTTPLMHLNNKIL